MGQLASFFEAVVLKAALICNSSKRDEFTNAAMSTLAKLISACYYSMDVRASLSLSQSSSGKVPAKPSQNITSLSNFLPQAFSCNSFVLQGSLFAFICLKGAVY